MCSKSPAESIDMFFAKFFSFLFLSIFAAFIFELKIKFIKKFIQKIYYIGEELAAELPASSEF